MSTNNIISMNNDKITEIQNNQTIINISTITISKQEYDFLHNENQRLTKENRELYNKIMKTDTALQNYESDAVIQRKNIAKLLDENEELKKENKKFNKNITELKEENKKLKEENKKLREENKKLSDQMEQLKDQMKQLINYNNILEENSKKTYNCMLIGQLSHVFIHNMKNFVLEGRDYYEIESVNLPQLFNEKNLSDKEKINFNKIISKFNSKDELYKFINESKKDRLSYAHPDKLRDSIKVTKNNLKEMISNHYVPPFNKRIEIAHKMIDILDDLNINNNNNLLEIDMI